MKGKEVGKYQVYELIGYGSFGKVYRAIDRTNNYTVALKYIPLKSKSRKDKESLKQEIDILKKLKHENIIELKDHIETGTEVILVTEFAGKDLSVLLEKQRKLKLDYIRQYLKQIVSALVYLSQNRIVHRDLKPQNILLKNGVVKLCDFGFARKMSAATICLHSLKGTPLYIAPEIISEKPYTHKIDIWSLGIIAYELFTGIPPFHADTYYKLLPKILYDKIKYPKDMDFYLRELIEGMLQKAPASRYDWDAIANHPFFRSNGRVALGDITPYLANRTESQLYKDFPLDAAMLRPSNLVNHNNKVEIEELRQYEEDLKQNKPYVKNLKVDIMFYHKLVSLFAMVSQGYKISKECITIAFRVLTMLITRVKLENEHRYEDITKKKDLMMAVVSLIQTVEEDYILAQVYNLIAYLLKNNFDSLQIDEESAEYIVYSTAAVLIRDKQSPSVITNLLKCIGILANQTILTLNNNEYLLKIVNETRLLSLIAGRYQPEREYVVVLECLEKFIHPLKGEQSAQPRLLSLLHALKVDTAYGFIEKGLIPTLVRAVESYTQQYLDFFLHVVYESVKVSQEFRKSLLTTGGRNWQPIHNKNKIYSLAINYLLMREEKQQLLPLDNLRQEVASSYWANEHEMVRCYQTAILHMALASKPDSKQRFDLNKLLARRAAELLQIDENRKLKSVDLVEGWACGWPSLKFDDIIVETVTSITEQEKNWDQNHEIPHLLEQFKVYDNIVKISGGYLNLKHASWLKLLPHLLLYYRELKGSNKKLTNSLIEALSIILNEDELGRLRYEGGYELQASYIINIFILMRELVGKDEKKMGEFYAKCDNLNLHRLILSDYMLTDRAIFHSLPILLKIIQKGTGNTLDYMAISGLPKIKKLFKDSREEILIEIVQIVSLLARSKSEYYSNIAQLGITYQLPRYLTSNVDLLKEKTLNLIGNLAKHSTLFFDEFQRHKVLSAINTCLKLTNPNTSAYEKILKNIIYAIGNISYYNYLFKEDIKPMIQHFSCALTTDDEHLLSNTISTLSNLLRHSNCYLAELTKEKVTQRMLEIVKSTKNQNIMVFSLNFLQKAVQYPYFVGMWRDELVKVLKNVQTGGADSEATKKLKKIYEKL